MRVIDEIWITTLGGLTLFNQSKDEFDPLLIGGFFSAIHNFAHNIGEQGVKSIIFGESKIMVSQGILHDEKFLFVSRSHKDVKDEKITNLLKQVEGKFFQHFESELMNWKGDADQFHNFGWMIKEIFEDTPEKRAKKAIW